MRKIKITLASGNTIEKPLITAFKGTYGDYVVLDNESVGSMGLPVILISKVQDSNISTITDANEWNAVKENLRNIIAGNQIIKVNVLDAYNGADVYYKQLTLPVASFDALKATGDNEEQPIASAPVEPIPVQAEPVAPVMPEAPMTPEAPASPVPEVTPVEPTPSMAAPEVAPVEPTPVPTEPVAPVMPEAPANMGTPISPMPEVAPVEPTPVQAELVAPVMPEAPMIPEAPISPAPEVAPIPDVNEQAQAPVDLTSEKEAFLKACENMFDALVSKFNK